VTENTAIVVVGEVFTAPPQLGDYTGKEITIQLEHSEGVEDGLEAVFFTTSWIYGESLAVMEVGRIEGKVDAKEIREQIAQAELALADQALEERIALAELVILGTVVRTAPEMEYRQSMPVTEHTPDWWEATILVESVEKGQLSKTETQSLFPNSRDEAWIESPKFREGQHGIWILQSDQEEKGWPTMRIPGYTALDPLDFQDASQLNRIRALIKRSG
jgi:hypothetical protein